MKNFTIGVLFIISFLIGMVAGNILTKNTEVLISDRKSACEKAGGHYNLYYIDLGIDNHYYEKCKISEQEIKDF